MLQPHQLKIVLLQPQIAPNTGNIARTCVATGTALHLVRPLGFQLTDRALKRAGMDFWPRVDLTIHERAVDLFRAIGQERFWFFTSKSDRPCWEIEFRDGDWLIFGSETSGIDPAILQQYPGRDVALPQRPGERCLNLSTAAGIGLYEALRRVQR